MLRILVDIRTKVSGQNLCEDILDENIIRPCDNLDDVRELEQMLKNDTKMQEQLVTLSLFHCSKL